MFPRVCLEQEVKERPPDQATDVGWLTSVQGSAGLVGIPLKSHGKWEAALFKLGGSHKYFRPSALKVTSGCTLESLRD